MLVSTRTSSNSEDTPAVDPGVVFLVRVEERGFICCNGVSRLLVYRVHHFVELLWRSVADNIN